ncbi:PREDICTED: DEAD-box ATP-dependent RNA helicase 13 [Tarenaya hassleriana]|uniref:DEAD-box ATP-dependent RNA helicase 13 n=1 Tax=Tarenaya hassleriana TaxID=28532 RepID=UPI0008FCE5E4|nr:PREDICTED: DEAD-box ATP-dependent RNA helicase 13 [Tarenaya hassleriana]
MASELKTTDVMASSAGKSPSIVQKTKKKISQNRKRNEHEAELERMDSLPWNASLPIVEDDDEEAFSSLFVGSGELDGGFLSLEEIDEADYALPVPNNKRKTDKVCGDEDDHEEAASEVIEGSQEEEEERKGETNKTKEKKTKKKKKKKQKNVKEEEKNQDCSVAGSSGENNQTEEPIDEEEIPPEYSGWNSMRLHPLLMKSICRLGFKEPTPIQKACFPVAAYQGKDVIGAAETGSGKTLAFGLPILQRLLDEREKVANLYAEKGEDAEKYAAKGYLRALIITPTRELALQVTEHLKDAAKDLSIRVVPIVGGMSSAKQERLLRAKPEIVVGTPGRLWELMSTGEKHLVELHSLSFFVLDEADRMIENGHFRELQSIIDLLPVTSRSAEGQNQNVQNCVTVSTVQRKKRQTFVFSATIALSADFRRKLKRGSLKSKQSTSEGLNSIEILSERAGMRDNVAIVDLTTTSILAHKIEESFLESREEDKDAYLYYILSVHGQGRTIVFCTSVAALRHICASLQILGLNVCKLYSDMKQQARLKAIDRFRASDNGILVATDVAARGLDISNVRTVIHYQLPHSAEVYVHRSGRTARAFADGCSIALIAPNDTSKFVALCKSFAKESVKRFPLDNSYMPEVMKRLSLARQIDKIQRKDSREKANKTWIERNAESMELILEDDEREEERANNIRQKKATSTQLKKLQQELSALLSRPMQPKTFSRRYLAGAGVSSVMQHQFEKLAKQKQAKAEPGGGGDNKRRKLVVIGQDCIEPLQALRSAGKEVMDMKEMADKRRNLVDLTRKRKEEKKRMREQRRKQKKKKKQQQQ